MSSYPRRLQRKALRNRTDYQPKSQPTRIHSDGYSTLTPTKGWRWVSNRRLAAQRRMAALLGA